MRWVMESNYTLVMVSLIMLIYSCCTNNITGRFQVTFLPELELRSLATQEYRQFIGKHRILRKETDSTAEMVKRVGEKLTGFIQEYYRDEKFVQELLRNYNWEYTLVESPEVNAWCLPGGKIVVYTGLLRIARNEDALAIVMGHEIAHALAQHGNERISHSLLVRGMEIVLALLTAGHPVLGFTAGIVFPASARYKFLLPNLRHQELEADRLGLIYTTLAGFNEQEAIPLWKRMHKATAGFTPPEFQSTHPSEESRIKELRRFMPLLLEMKQKWVNTKI